MELSTIVPSFSITWYTRSLQKIFASRLKSVLDHIVLPSQSAFISGRDNDGNNALYEFKERKDRIYGFENQDGKTYIKLNGLSFRTL